MIFAELIPFTGQIGSQFADGRIRMGNEVAFCGKSVVMQMGFRFFQDEAVQRIMELKFVFFQFGCNVFGYCERPLFSVFVFQISHDLFSISDQHPNQFFLFGIKDFFLIPFQRYIRSVSWG